MWAPRYRRRCRNNCDANEPAVLQRVTIILSPVTQETTWPTWPHIVLIKPPESTHDVLTTDHPPGVKQLCDHQSADGVTNIDIINVFSWLLTVGKRILMINLDKYFWPTAESEWIDIFCVYFVLYGQWNLLFFRINKDINIISNPGCIINLVSRQPQQLLVKWPNKCELCTWSIWG